MSANVRLRDPRRLEADMTRVTITKEMVDAGDKAWTDITNPNGEFTSFYQPIEDAQTKWRRSVVLAILTAAFLAQEGK